jgi:ATP-dependent DNA helicase UvrD/PcrA
MDLLASLNFPQREAVEHGRGPALVLAGAGSGKTRVIAFRIAYLVVNGAVRPENILAVTFTNKAAKEMSERVHALLGPSRTAEPLISTFHSFGVRLLRREIQHIGYKKDFSIYDTDDQKRLMKQLIEEFGGKELELSPREVLSRISYAKNHNVPPEGYAPRFRSEKAEDIQELFTRYNARLRQSNALDFDDILLMAVKVLSSSQPIREYYSDWYRYILVDEYQDTNRPQYELLRLLTSKHQNLFVVGDEDQSIYKFRGADIQNILKFEKDFPGSRIVKLEQNYRSTQNILRVAAAVVENNTERKGKTLWTENIAGDVATCYCARSAREEALWAADHIDDILSESPEYRIAILYRANFLSRNFEDVLTEKGIVYALVGSVAFFGRMEVKDMLAYLRVLYNPEDDVALLRIMNTPPRGIGHTTAALFTQVALEKGLPILQAMRELCLDPQQPARAMRAATKFLELLDGWSAKKDELSKAALLETILKDTQYREMLLKDESAEEADNRLANIDELIRAASDSEARGETAFEFLDRASLSSELDHLDPNARVALMTLHSAKGLEFDVVFLAGMEEGLFPHSLSSNSLEDLEEERRLCYVGITRAMRKLYLSWTPYRRSFGAAAGVAGQPSRFFNEMPQDLLEGLDAQSVTIRESTRHFSREYDDAGQADNNDFGFEVGLPRERENPPAAAPKSIAELRAYIRQTEGSNNTDAAKEGPRRTLKAGVRVRHAQFGDGIVLSRERVGNDIKLTVTFSRVGRKSLMEKYAKLEII